MHRKMLDHSRGTGGAGERFFCGSQTDGLRYPLVERGRGGWQLCTLGFQQMGCRWWQFGSSWGWGDMYNQNLNAQVHE
jgi:hypothetical protein